MKVFYNNSFTGHWPVGTSAIVRSTSKELAAKILELKLKEIGLEQTIHPNEMIEMNKQCVILQDGDY